MVLFVSYSGELGGAERLLVDYASALGVERVLACPGGPLARAARDAGVPVILRPQRSLRLCGDQAAAAARIAAHALEVRALARDLGAELVVAWGMRSAIAAAAAARKPFLFAHNDLLPSPLVAAAVRAASRRAAAVVALSYASARELGPHATVIHPGVDVSAFGAYDRAPVEPPTVLVLGALVGWKRPELALEALALARRRLPELRLMFAGAPIAGDTAVLDALRERAGAPDLAGAVTFAGQHADPRAALAAAVCLLHCAEREPFGLAVLEALASARPAIVPDACGPAEIVDSGCGILYPAGDERAAAEAIVRVVSDPALAAKLGRRGRERARERFDRSRARRQFAEIVAAASGARELTPQPEPAAGRALSIVTVIHNSATELRALLDSIARHLPAAETIVVDCASADDGLEVARSRPGVQVIALGENLGFGSASNRGVEHATRPVVALLNPDVRLLDGSLDLLARQALAPGAAERLLAPLVLNPDGTRQDTAHPAPGSPADLIRCLVPPAALPGRARIPLSPWRARSPRAVGWAVGCALVAQTQTLARLGPFHESLFLYGEDLELGLRARRAGIETWFEPAARVIHERAHTTAAAFGGEPFELLARGRHDAIALTRGPLAAAVDDCGQAVTFASRAALKRVLGRRAARERRQLGALRSMRRSRRRIRSAQP
ncbi:MAG: glycosyltransferase [Solirubrobacteraceae bacterium]